MKARFTPGARQEFLAAAAFRRKVERALRRLERYPSSGRAIPEFPDLPHREVALPPYRLFYRVEGKTVWIVAVWHGARIPARPSTPPGDDAGYPSGVHEPAPARRRR